MEKKKEYIEKLRESGLRPTKQRIKICDVLFNRESTFHFSISDLIKQIQNTDEKTISLATVYNTVHAFKKKGYLKEIALEGNKTHYDTNTSIHHHFYDEDTERLIDINDDAISVSNIPNAPSNKSIKGVEVLIRLANDYHKQK